MAFSELEKKKIEKEVRAVVDKRRPPPHIRPELDLDCRVKGQSVEIFEVRPRWRHPGEKMEHAVAKPPTSKRSGLGRCIGSALI